MNSSFCVLPWVSLATDTNGDIVPCCVSTQKIKKVDGSNYNLGSDDLTDIVNSKDFVELRQAMVEGNHVAGCQECYDNEKYGTSQRLQFNARYKVDDLAIHIEAKPKYLDIRPSSLCNLRCRSCSPIASSQFAKETNSLQHKGMDQFHAYLHPSKSLWTETETFQKNVSLALETATDIYLTGGEPSIIQTNIDMITSLVSSGQCKDINLTISTNLTNTNHKFFDLLSHFKHVTIFVSVDGYTDMQEYLRYPCSWSSIDTNLRYLLNLDSNIQLVLTPVVQITNLNKLHELLEYVDILNTEFTKQLYVYPINLEAPEYLDIVNLPAEYKERCYDRIKEWTIRNNNNFFDFIKNKATVEVDFTIHLEKFVTYNKLFDMNRNHSLELINPELVNVLKEHKLW